MSGSRDCQHRRQFLRRSGGTSLAAGLTSQLILPRLTFGEERRLAQPRPTSASAGSNMEEAVASGRARGWDGLYQAGPDRTDQAECDWRVRIRPPRARKFCTP